MVTCSQFLEEYSDYRDGRVERSRCEALAGHLEVCPACARYDRVVGGGVRVVRELPLVEPSADFMDRLQHRLYHLEEEGAARGVSASGAPVAWTLAIAAVIGASALLPTLRSRPPTYRLPAVVAHEPHHFQVVPVLFHSGPLIAPGSGPSAAEPTVTALLYYSPLGSRPAASVRSVRAH